MFPISLGGDELQGIKKGIMEWVDLIVVNKADGMLQVAATQVRLVIHFIFKFPECSS